MSRTETLAALPVATGAAPGITTFTTEAMRIAALQCFEQRFQMDQVAERLVRIIREHAPQTA